jgi:hypothetical protein
MYIPSHVLKGADYSKAKNKTARQKVFGNKIVDAKLSPLLYNIEFGLQIMDHVLNDTNSNVKSTMDPVQADRGYLAREMLLKTNISYILQEKQFSLLRAQGNKDDLENKDITDETQYQETFNQNSDASDKYTDVNDPFYKSDEAAETSQEYMQEVNSDGLVAIPPDLSVIASGITAANMSKNYRGKSKYYDRHSQGVD